jgi:hypothetical protein
MLTSVPEDFCSEPGVQVQPQSVELHRFRDQRVFLFLRPLLENQAQIAKSDYAIHSPINSFSQLTHFHQSFQALPRAN